MSPRSIRLSRRIQYKKAVDPSYGEQVISDGNEWPRMWSRSIAAPHVHVINNPGHYESSCGTPAAVSRRQPRP